MHSLFINYDARKSRGRENVTAKGRLKSIDKESFWLEINICVEKVNATWANGWMWW